MRRMSMSRLQNLSPNWRQRHHEQPLGIPGHKRPSLPQRRWNSFPGRFLLRKRSSSKLQLVPGQRESDLEVDQGWHLWDTMKYKGDTTLSFRLRVSKEQIPLDLGFRANVVYSDTFPANIMPISQYRIYHILRHRVSSSQKETHPLHSQSTKFENLEMRRMSMSKLQSLSTNWRQRHHEQPLGIPGKAFTPSSLMELSHKLMLVTEVFFFKASASAWSNWKRLGSRSRLTSVRPDENQRRQNSQFQTPGFQTTIPTRFRVNVFDTEMHFQPISCQYPSRKHTTSDHTEWVQVKNQFTHFTDSQQKLETGNAKDEHEQTTKPSKKLATKTPWAATWNPGKGLHSLIADGIVIQVDACHGSVRLQSFS